VTFLVMKKLINLLDKEQLCHYSAQNWLLENLDVQQEKLLRTGFNVNIILPGIIYQVIDMANVLIVDHVRKELKTYLY
jgi:hypothetical protein